MKTLLFQSKTALATFKKGSLLLITTPGHIALSSAYQFTQRVIRTLKWVAIGNISLILCLIYTLYSALVAVTKSTGFEQLTSDLQTNDQPIALQQLPGSIFCLSKVAFTLGQNTPRKMVVF